MPLEFGALGNTLPVASRQLARRLSLRETARSRRLHGNRSVTATLARGGFMIPVMRPGSRPIDYVFLIARRDTSDQERERALRLVDALARGGLALTAYDYHPDPRTLTPASGGADRRGSGAMALDLRALRELHPRARPVLMTDGRELVDYFSRQPLPFVENELRRWPVRMLLTPVPIGEWGEVEMNLSQALTGLMGRSTKASFEDLVSGLTRERRPAPFEEALARLAPRRGRRGSPGGLRPGCKWHVSSCDATRRRAGTPRCAAKTRR